MNSNAHRSLQMAGSRNTPFIFLLICLIATPALAGGNEAWKAESHPTNGATDEAPSYCGALAALIDKRLNKLRTINAALRRQKNAPPSSVLELLSGDSYETDWEKEQLATLAKGKAEAAELNERYRGQKCGSIDIEKELARAPNPVPVKPLKSGKRK